MKPFLTFITGVWLLLLSSLGQADYATVNGIKMYYAVQGSGTPLVLLHGGYDDSEMWMLHSKILSSKFRVIRIDSRGHGRSELGDLPITYEQMASDTLALLDHLGVSNAHYAGWSDGAVIASLIAARQPHRVNQLVMFGAAYQSNAYVEAFNLLLQEPPLFVAFTDALYKPRYLRLSPNPALWEPFRDHLYALWQSDCYVEGYASDVCLTALESISAPTLVVAGDLEIIKPSHTRAIAAAIPGADLKIVPGATHYLPKLRPIYTSSLIARFLNN